MEKRCTKNSNIHKFIDVAKNVNSEDIPEDIKKVIDDYFFEML